MKLIILGVIIKLALIDAREGSKPQRPRSSLSLSPSPSPKPSRTTIKGSQQSKTVTSNPSKASPAKPSVSPSNLPGRPSIKHLSKSMGENSVRPTESQGKPSGKITKRPPVNPTKGGPSVNPSKSSSVKPTKGGPSVKPTKGGPSVKPTKGGPSVKPTRGGPSVKPTKGGPSVKPTKGGPSVKPTKGGPSVKPTKGDPSVNPSKSRPIKQTKVPPGKPTTKVPGNPNDKPTKSPDSGKSKEESVWSEWGPWKCQKCGKNKKQLRRRRCDKPKGGGAQCEGSSIDTEGPPCKKCGKAIGKMKCRFPGKKYNKKLKDKNSTEYQELAGKVSEDLIKKLNASKVENVEFSNGSIIFTADIHFEVDGDSTKEPVNYTKFIQETILKAGSIGNFSVDPKSITVSNVQVEGVEFGEWIPDYKLCDSMCCNGGTHVYENRTCTETNSSCLGLIVDRLTDCKACYSHMTCSGVGSNSPISVLLMIFALAFSLRILIG